MISVTDTKMADLEHNLTQMLSCLIEKMEGYTLAFHLVLVDKQYTGACVSCCIAVRPKPNKDRNQLNFPGANRLVDFHWLRWSWTKL